ALLLYALRFFFQAADGIRVFHVTGVQTCALPISRCRSSSIAENSERISRNSRAHLSSIIAVSWSICFCASAGMSASLRRFVPREIGRASRRGGLGPWACGGSARKKLVEVGRGSGA